MVIESAAASCYPCTPRTTTQAQVPLIFKSPSTEIGILSLPSSLQVKPQSSVRARLAPSALAETAASVLVTSLAVGVAATLLVKRTSTGSAQEGITTESTKECEECGGTGVCSGCKGEGFVFKKLSEETAEKSRKAAKNMATRYTAGLPTKWTYCNKCSSTRSCTTCGGSGKIANC